MRNVVMLLLALAAAALSGTMLRSQYFGRGAGAVEIGISIILLIFAAPMAITGVRSRSAGDRAVALLVLLLMPALAFAAAARVKLNRQSDVALAGCSSNLASLAQALETWREEHGGALPEALSEATRGAMPSCPAAGTDTYTPGYEAAPETGVYTLSCASAAHSEHFYDSWRVAGAGYPQFPSLTGKVITRPQEAQGP